MNRRVSFDDLVIRKNYMNKVSGIDCSDKLKHFEKNIKITSDMMFRKYMNVFERSGLTIDDVLSLSRLYAYYYLDIYSAEKNGNEKAEKNGLITFIRQRMDYLASTCESQSENFYVGKNLSGFYAKTNKAKEMPSDVIILNPTDYGYRKIGNSELKLIKKSNAGKTTWLDKHGFEVVKLEFFDNLSSDEYREILYENSDTFKDPEEMMMEKQENERFEAEISHFESKSMVDKIGYLHTISIISRNVNKQKNAKKLIKILTKQHNNERDFV